MEEAGVEEAVSAQHLFDVNERRERGSLRRLATRFQCECAEFEDGGLEAGVEEDTLVDGDWRGDGGGGGSGCVGGHLFGQET